MQEVGHHQPIEVRRSPIHGWGVFAKERIPADVLIETAPGVLIPEEILSMCYYLVMADGMPAKDLQLDQYGIWWADGKVFIPLGWGGLYNHSEEPSAAFVENKENQTLGIRSLREIAPGEEITVHYGEHWWERKDYLQRNGS